MARLPRKLALWGGAGAVAAAGFAFMASNSVPVSGAGDSAATVTGYYVGSITYTENAAPGIGASNIAKVQFNLSRMSTTEGAPAASNVHAYLFNGSVSYDYSSCTGGWPTYTCSGVSGALAPISSTHTLEVVAAQ